MLADKIAKAFEPGMCLLVDEGGREMYRVRDG